MEGKPGVGGQGKTDNRRSRRVARSRRGSRVIALVCCLGLISFTVILTGVNLFIFSDSEPVLNPDISRTVPRHLSPIGRTFTRVSFVMDESFAHAWLRVIKRVTFPIELHVEHLVKDDGADAPRVVRRQTENVRATFYGKSSLTLKYTTRRSVQIHSDIPIHFTSPSPVDPLHPGDLRENSIALKDFLIVSLWEDRYRIAYRSSIDLMRPMDLFFAYAQMAELRCFPDSDTPSRGHPCAPATGSAGVRNGTRRGQTLGAYFILETPQQAICRRMRAAFSAFEAAGDNESAASRAPALSRRVFETSAEHAARLAHWRTMWKLTRDVYKGDESAAMELAIPEYLSSRPPNDHSLIHVPSYKKNSSYVVAYKRMKSGLEHLGFFDLGGGVNTTTGSERFVDLPQYFAWIAINTVLQNGDFDDEAYFFGMFSSEKPGENNILKNPMPIYFGLMAWDYDTIFRECHRKAFFKTPLMFCAETSVDYRIVKQQQLYKRYTQILYQILKLIGPKHFARSVTLANRELQTIFALSPGTQEVTFGPDYEPDAGLQWIITSFNAQRRGLLESLASIYGPSVLHIQEAENGYDVLSGAAPLEGTKSGNGDNHATPYGNGPSSNNNDHKKNEQQPRLQHVRLLGESNTAPGKEMLSLRRRLASVVRLTDASISTGDLTLITMRGPAPAMPVVCPGPNCHFIAATGLYCARVTVPLSFARLSAAALESVGIAHEIKSVPSAVTVDVPLCRRNSQRGSTETCMADFVKPDPMHLLVPATETTVPDSTTVLRIIVPHVWPTASEEAVFIARVFHRSTNDQLRWDRRNLPITSSSAFPNGGQTLRSATMLPRGFAAVRLITATTTTAAAAAAAAAKPQSHRENFTATDPRGPLLHIAGLSLSSSLSSLSTARVEVLGAAADIRFSSIARPPSVPAGSNSSGGLVDGAGASHGSTLAAPATQRVRCPIFISGPFLVQRGATLEIPAGCAVVMRPAASFIIEGTLRLAGTMAEPIVVTRAPKEEGGMWQTIHVKGEGARLESHYTFITGAGCLGRLVKGTGSHHKHSAAVSATGRAIVSLHHTFFVDLLGPAIAAGSAAVVRVSDSLVQWAEMGIECKMCTFVSERSMWTHFPSWDTHYADKDNDAMYLSGGEHRVVDTVIAHTKDDGIDTGTPKGVEAGGTLLVDNTIIESCMHEGIAISSDPKGNRVVVIARSLVQHCQQGIELGYTSSHMSAALTSSLVRHCAVGVRYGDNYNWHYDGELVVHNSTLVHNQLNVLNYERKFSSPRGPSYFRADAALPARHARLLPGALASHMAASANAFVSLWPDGRPQEGEEGNSMCCEFFTIPTRDESALRIMNETPTPSYVSEDIFIRDVLLSM